MDKELLDLLNDARQNGATESQLDQLIDAYNQKKKSAAAVEVAEPPKSDLSVGQNGQLEQSAPATLPSQSVDTDQLEPPTPKNPFFNLKSPPEQPKPLAPEDAVPKPAPVQSLYDDYSKNKVDIDRTLTSTVGDDPAFGKYVDGDSLFKAMINPQSPDITLLSKYSKKRATDLENERLTRKAALDKKYPESTIPKGMGQAPGEWRPQQYHVELDALNAEIAERKQHIEGTIFDAAKVKKLNDDLKKVAKPKFDMKDWGRYMRNAIADPTLEKEERYEQKGIPLTPSEGYYNDKLGFSAMASALKDLDDKGVDIKGNPAMVELYGQVAEGKKKLLTDHKDFAKDQAARLISNEIFQDKNWFQVMTGLYTVNDKDIKKAAKKLGLPDDIAKLVHEGDIQTSNMFGEFTNELAARPGANIGTFIGRPFRRFVLGQDLDAINYHYDQLNKKYTTLFANAPDAGALFGTPTEVAADPTQENFLEDIQSTHKGKFNWSVSAIANTIGNGAGQMIQYGLGGNAVGGSLRGVNKLLKLKSSVEASKDVGLVTYGFLNSYEQSYQKARQLVGDDPEKEGLRGVVGAAGAMVEAFSELIFKDYKVTDKLFSVKSEGSKQLLELLAKSKAEDAAKVLASAIGKKTLAKAIQEGVVKTVKGTTEEVSEEIAALLGDVVISALTNKKSLENRDLYQEAIETAVQTALSAAVPIGLGEMRSGSRTSGIHKAMIYEIGSDPKTYLSQINKDAADGKISDAVANKKGAIVNTMADIVKTVPEVSIFNGQPLSEKDRQDYAYNLLHSAMLFKKLETDKKTDKVQEKITTDQLNELAKEREAILAGADGIDRDMNGKPVFERDDRQQAAINAAVDLIPAEGLPGFGEVAPEDAAQTVKFIAQQAQNVQADGSVSKLQDSKKAYDAAVNTYGEALVNAAIAAHPLESLVTPVEEPEIKTEEVDFTGKDNNFLANKEPGFFNPQERETYNELMKKPETEAEAAKMVADKKEEIKKFAPKPAEEILPEEKQAEPIVDQRADDLLNQRIPVAQALDTDVDYNDIITGETKTGKAHKVKEEMVNRYNSLKTLIECL